MKDDTYVDIELKPYIEQREDHLGRISFEVGEPGEKVALIELHPNGDIYVSGRLAESDKQVVDALRDFLWATGCLRRVGREGE